MKILFNIWEGTFVDIKCYYPENLTEQKEYDIETIEELKQIYDEWEEKGNILMSMFGWFDVILFKENA